MVMDEKILERVYNAKDHEELRAAYGEWAGQYDQDLIHDFGYVAPAVAANGLSRFMEDRNLRIMDVGSGTGLVGVALDSLGYNRIDALDYSAEMLEQARTKGIYDSLYQADLMKPLEFADDAYDAVICVGTFTYGHVDATAFDELVRITRPGGLVVFTIREDAYEECGFRARIEELERDGAWKVEETSKQGCLTSENVDCKLCICRVS